MLVHAQEEAKNQAAVARLGKTPSACEVFYLGKSERKFPPAMRVEQMTFNPQKLPWSFIAKCGSRLGQLTVC